MEFPPLHPSLPPLFWIAVIVLLASVGLTILFLSKRTPWKSRLGRQVAPLWFFILALVALSTVFYTFLEHRQTGTVRIDAEGIHTGMGTSRYEDITRIYLRPEIERSMINPNITGDTTMWLVIEDRNGKQHALSEDQYDLVTIQQTLKGFLEEENRQRENN